MNSERLIASMLLPLLLVCGPAWGGKVKGVEVPETARVGGQQLALNGTGIRTKFFFDIYVGALYLPQRTQDAAKAIAMDGPKRITMDILYKKITQDQMKEAWEEGFRDNLSDERLATVRPGLSQLEAAFPDLKRGDHVTLDLIPGTGLRIAFNGEEKTVIAGDELQTGVLKVWLGEEPADDDLKAGMLGQE